MINDSFLKWRFRCCLGLLFGFVGFRAFTASLNSDKRDQESTFKLQRKQSINVQIYWCLCGMMTTDLVHVSGVALQSHHSTGQVARVNTAAGNESYLSG